MEQVRLLILGTGKMAEAHFHQFAAMDHCRIVAACDLAEERVRRFCAQHGIPNAFTDLADAIKWGGFDAVANVTPDGVHYHTSMRLMEAGYPVFCEKPLAVNYADAGAMADEAERHGVVNMVNLTFRNVAALHKVSRMVKSGAIGDLRHVEASYLQSWLTGNHWGDWRTEDAWLWRLSQRHGSKGVLGDIGIHVLDLASVASGSRIGGVHCRLKTFPKADENRIGDYSLDANDSCLMTVEFDNGAMGSIHCSRFATGHANDLTLRLFGTQGAIRLDTTGHVTRLRACRGGDIHSQKWKTVAYRPTPTTYERFIEAVRTGQNGMPDFRWAAGLQKLIDTCFESDERGAMCSVTYPEEEPVLAMA